MDKRLTKSSNNKMIAGICGGLAEYLNMDPTVVRLIYVILSIFTAFAGVLVYLIMWLVVPNE